MAGLNFLHAVAQAWEAGKLFHIDLNDQAPGRYDQDFRFGAANIKAAFFLVKFLEDVGYDGAAPLRRARLPHRGLRRRPGLRARLHAHLPDPQGARRALERRQGDPGAGARDRPVGDAAVLEVPRRATETLLADSSTAPRSPSKGLGYEKLDQLTMEVLLGVR